MLNIPFIETSYIFKAKTIIFIKQSRIFYGIYTDDAIGYQIKWDIRIVSFKNVDNSI
jgi:hypothetical protein